MEHSLHLGSTHFLNALEKEMNGTAAGEGDGGVEAAELTLVADEVDIVDHSEGTFNPGDTVGKVVSFVGQVRMNFTS